jgi:coniferyl-aldehyde dehydrogenase
MTLELGGKCPAILTGDSVDAASVRTVIGTKLIKNGQMCISVDYALVPATSSTSSWRTPSATSTTSCPGTPARRTTPASPRSATWTGS